jgi:hypothetical protein
MCAVIRAAKTGDAKAIKSLLESTTSHLEVSSSGSGQQLWDNQLQGNVVDIWKTVLGKRAKFAIVFYLCVYSHAHILSLSTAHSRVSSSFLHYIFAFFASSLSNLLCLCICFSFTRPNTHTHTRARTHTHTHTHTHNILNPDVVGRCCIASVKAMPTRTPTSTRHHN